MFTRRSLAAINMDPAYMARHDGSEQATGRGSGQKSRKGLDVSNVRNEGNSTNPTPYMQMMFAPMERRLDIAIFRALFASSARQARQFVLHGAVTVNGKKMTYPGYLLNPGDMFQVEIERVMAATGKPKKKSGGSQKAPKNTEANENAEGEEGQAAEGEAAETVESAAEGATEGAVEGVAEAADTEAVKSKHFETLKELKIRAQRIMKVKNQFIRAKEKKALRKMLVQVKETLERGRKADDPTVAEMDQAERQLTDLLSGLSLSSNQHSTEAKKARIELKRQQAIQGPDIKKSLVGGGTIRSAQLGLLTPNQRNVLLKALQLEAENPYDSSKPYATPWKPRDWMSPFAFIPRYLEVNQKICAAVYLRHPVARPGLSEVPTPFAPSVSQLAFNWYLRRG
ncbi:hypothetical protein F5144DRAFT_231820 [Chaetomium tenue]|uniref:Uncharacterized protein n=1 Tax=Chaetomium tenue TaxID=1854479 RepID=A0ACB7P8L7_9PEZI|nr:hypothetical protein F5144DRAFT_231820 [Chaetomium globosum]